MGRGKKGGRGGSSRTTREPRFCEEEEEYMRQLAGQDPRAGRMPTDSEESEDEKIGQIDHQPVINRQRTGAGQNANVGMLPPSDSESGSDSEEEIVPHGMSAQLEPPRRRRDEPEGPDEEQMSKDMDRLRLIKEKREKDRLARIEKEGWDRFAPITETNKPPTGAPRPQE